MSHIASKWAYEQTAPSASAKAVLVALASFADDDGSCFPGQDRLAVMAQLCRATVNRQIRALETVGLVSRERRHSEFGQRTSDRYQLSMKPAGLATVSHKGRQSESHGNDPQVTLTRSLSNSDAQPKSTSVTGTVREPSVNRQSANKPRQRKSRTSAPDDLPVTPSMRSWAAEKARGVNLERQTEKFLNHHRSKGNVFADWTGAWRNWMLNAVDYGHVEPQMLDAGVPEAWQ